MRLLAVETSTPASSVALTDDGEEVVASRCLLPGNSHVELLMTAIDELFKTCGWSVHELDGLAVAVGPGAFIGLRVGIATVKGLAMGADKPVMPVSTLDALAQRGVEFPRRDDALTGVVCPMIDARRGEVYTARYRQDGEASDALHRLGDELMIAPEPFLSEITGDALFLGDGAEQYRELIEKRLQSRAHFAADGASGRLLGPHASTVARIALRRWSRADLLDAADLAPVYFRAAVADPPGRVAEPARSSVPELKP